MKKITDTDLMCKTFVWFDSCWNGYASEKTEFMEVEDRDISKVVVPDDAFRFLFFDQVVGTVQTEGGVLNISSEFFGGSPQYYYGGVVYSREEIIEKAKEEMLLDFFFQLAVVNWADWEKIILTREGKYMQFNDGDVLIAIEGEEPPPKKMSRVIFCRGRD